MPTLQWLTRDEDVKTSIKVPYRLLEEVPEYSFGDKNTGNMILQGDNLEALKSLLPFYAGQVKCIYIDPPYNTGSAFGHYDDNLEHTKWLSVMYPRLELLREFLTEDGSIWISLDDNEQAYCKILCDEVFGRKNFVNNVIWQKKYSPQNDAKWLSDNHDFIMVYTKDKNKWRPNLLPRGEKQNKFYKYDDNNGRGVWRCDNMTVKRVTPRDIYEITTPFGRKVFPPAGTSWRFGKEKVVQMIKDNRIYFGKEGKGVPQLKRYLSEVKDGVTCLTLWTYEEVGHNQEGKREVREFNSEFVFETPKPERLIQRILVLGSSPGDIVMDSFLGSGTTAAVAHKMDRKYIGIEMGEHAITHCLPRLQKVIDGEQGGISTFVNWQGGGGFRFFKLGSEVFDSDGYIKQGLKFNQLAAHIWFSETKTPFEIKKDKTPFLGVYEGIAYVLLYNGVLGDRRPDGGNVLTLKVLDIIKKGLQKYTCEKMVIYGESSRLGKERLKNEEIEFKQTPYDIKAR